MLIKWFLYATDIRVLEFETQSWIYMKLVTEGGGGGDNPGGEGTTHLGQTLLMA